jgi:hypothetical protein
MKSLKSLDFPEGALLISVVIAALCGLWALLAYSEDKRFIKRAVPTLGTVVAVLKHTEYERKENGRTHKNDRYTPLVSFTDAQNRVVKFEGRYDTHMEDAWKTGTTVRVLYPPGNPAAAIIDHPTQLLSTHRLMRNLMFISLIVGCSLFGVAKFEASRKPQRAPLTDDEARRAYFGE